RPLIWTGEVDLARDLDRRAAAARVDGGDADLAGVGGARGFPLVDTGAVGRVVDVFRGAVGHPREPRGRAFGQDQVHAFQLLLPVSAVDADGEGGEVERFVARRFRVEGRPEGAFGHRFRAAATPRRVGQGEAVGGRRDFVQGP